MGKKDYSGDMSITSQALSFMRSFFPPRDTGDEEKLNLVKYSEFENENEKELSMFSSSGKKIKFTETDLSDDLPKEKPGQYKQFDDEDEEEDEEDKKDEITEWQAGWNITNAIQGMFIVSFPYAVVQGGYWTILAIVLVAYICCYTGKILVECLYEEQKDGSFKRVCGSYVEIASLAWGPGIAWTVVSVAQIIELLMTCILYVLLCGELVSGSFPDSGVDLSSWIMIATAFLLPCAFLQSLRSVSWLSWWCTMAHMVINGIIIVYCITQARDWKFDEVQVKIDMWTFPISLGIVVFSYTSQIFVPTLEGKMRDKNKFNCMMHSTHIAAAIFKAGFAYICFLTWGNHTKEVISQNLPDTLRISIDLIFVAKAMFSYPLPFYAAVEIFETAFFQGKPDTIFPTCTGNDSRLKFWGVCLRLSLVIFTMMMAIFIPHFAILMGLTGSITGTMLSFVWPSYFHLYIKWKKLRWYTKVVDVCIIILGFFFGGLGMYYSGRALVRAFEGLPTNPQAHTARIPHAHGMQ